MSEAVANANAGYRSQRALVAAAVVLITLAAAAVRIHIALAEAMWRDEAQTIAIASQAFPFGITKALEGDGNAPLFYLLEHFIVASRDNPLRELQDRSLSVVLGIVLVPLTFLATRSIGGSAAAALVSCALIASAPIAVEQATQARPYAAIACCAALMIWGIARWRASLLACSVYVAAAATAFYLHTFAAPILVGMAVACTLDAWKNRAFRRLAAAHAFMFALVAPGVVVALRQASALTTGGQIPWASRPSFTDAWHYAVVLLAGGSASAQILVATVALLMIVVAISRRGTRNVTIGVVVALGVALGLAFFTGALVMRYNSAIGVMFAITFTTALDVVRNRMAAAATAILVVTGYLAFTLSTGYFQSVGSRSASRAAAMVIVAQAHPDDVVILLPDSIGVAINYYLPARWKQIDPPLRGRAELLDFRQWKPQLAAAESSSSAEVFLDEASRNHQRAWLVIHAPLRQPLPATEARLAMPGKQWTYAQTVVSAFTDRYYVVGQPLNFLDFREGLVVMLGQPDDKSQ